MKTYFLVSILAMPLTLCAQPVSSIDLVRSNLMSIDTYQSLNEKPFGNTEKGVPAIPVPIEECHESGDFYVTSRERNILYVSNIHTPSVLDSILPVAHPYGGSIGILSDAGVLVNSIFDSVFYYAQNGWSYYGHYSTTGDLIHCAGGNKSVFYMGGNLWHLNGNNQPQLIYKNIHYTCADLVVDSLERAWVLTGTVWPISDTLRVIDSTGYQVCAFPLKNPFNTINAYGMIMYQQKIWLGIGGSNPLYPGKLLPLDIISHEVVPGIPVNFPDLFFLDLESCEVSIPEARCSSSAAEESVLNAPEIRVFPNPSSDWVNVTCGVLLDKIEIINTAGMVLINILPTGKETAINLEGLSAGVYFIKLQSAEGQKILIQIKR